MSAIRHTTSLLRTLVGKNGWNVRGKATSMAAAVAPPSNNSDITSVHPAPHHSAKVLFGSSHTADFKYIWLRDNCRCPKCVDSNTRQKLIDTPTIDVNIRPKSLLIDNDGHLEVTWDEKEGTHVSTFDSTWLHKYGQSFIHNSFESDTTDLGNLKRPDLFLWNRAAIWENLPEMAFNEVMDSDEGLRAWLEMFYRYGFAILRGVPTAEERTIEEVVKHFAYVKETQYGVLFDVINLPTKDAHLAYTGVALAHHTDMNYREKSPGMQLLHCLKAQCVNDEKVSYDGGRSLFVDGFRVAKWMEENEPAAFHVLTSTPVRFSIRNEGMRYSATWPVICLDNDGDITEIHYNNRTMQPLQAPSHVVTPFYHAYKLFSQKLRESKNSLEFQMVPGDLVAFNNRRTLHGRTSYDPKIVDRHLKGCYVDIDEAFSKFDQLQARYLDSLA